MSHRLHRGTLVPVVAAVFAILVATSTALASTVLANPATSAARSSSAEADSSTGAQEARAQEWWLATLSTQQAWRTSQGAGVTVAVLSTGVSATQPDLAGNVITGPDYTDSGRSQGGPYWGVVGTAVASIIAGHGHGNGDNSGITGIAPRSKILSIRVTLEYNDPLNATSAITKRLPTAIANGIIYAVNHGAKVIDLPLDAGTFGLAADAAAAGGSPAELSAVRYALDKGVVLIAPAGDNGATTSSQLNYPAAYPGVVAVGATDRDGHRALFSSRGSYASLAAPGVDVMAATMVPGKSFGYVPSYATISTTSVASAMVAGVAALLVAKYPQLPVSDVVRALRASAASHSDVNAAQALSVAATLNPHVSTARPPASAPVKVRKTVPSSAPVRTAAPRTNVGMQAGAVLRDAVYGVCGLIVLVAAVLLVTRTRRTRAQRAAAKAGSGIGPAGHGLHEQRRSRPTATTRGNGSLTGGSIPLMRDIRAGGPLAGSSLSGGGLLSGGPLMGGSVSGGLLSGGPVSGGSLSGSSLAGLPMTGASLAGGSLGVDSLAGSPPAAGWPTTNGWDGTGPGEIAHSPAASRRPLLEPAPKSLRPKADDTGKAKPPWAPAARPDGLDRAAPVMPSGWFPSDPASGIRLPGGMPETPLTPEGFEGPDLTAPFAGRDVLSQSGLGLAAAPVPADFPVPADSAAPTDLFPAIADPDIDQPDDLA